MTKDLEDRNRKWQLLLETEERLFKNACELELQNWEKTEEQVEALREWWSCTNAIIWMFVRTNAQDGITLEPFPHFTLARLANISEELSRGIVPTFVSDAAARGRPLRRKERHHIAYAIFYIEAVQRGDITDRHHNKTVREIYGVTAKAVQKWMKQRDEICLGVPIEGYSPEQIEQKMRKCGAFYKVVGRGIY